MSNNHFYNNFHGSTFQSNFMSPNLVPPPPLPPPQFFVMPAAHAPPVSTSDQEYVKIFETKVLNVPSTKKSKSSSISQVRENLRDLLFSLNELKKKEKELIEKASTCSEDNWKEAIEKVNSNKNIICNSLSSINNFYLDILRKQVTKRAAKRLRLQRLKKEKKQAKEDRLKELEERSRNIDENLQKVKDAINKAKQEEELKLQADIVLKEVLHKKHNAKKFISKLEALKKLRNARLNTAKGRGENISLKESEEFDLKIEKLKLLWAQKLILYGKEEADQRAKLEQADDTKDKEGNETEKQTVTNLKKWRQLLFGDHTAAPQVDFHGDIARFIAVRRQWDHYVSDDGSTLPIGWVTPLMPSQ